MQTQFLTSALIYSRISGQNYRFSLYIPFLESPGRVFRFDMRTVTSGILIFLFMLEKEREKEREKNEISPSYFKYVHKTADWK